MHVITEFMVLAPEVISRKAYTHLCDAWAMGVCTYTLLSGNLPFFSHNDKDLQHMICEDEPSYKGYVKFYQINRNYHFYK